VGGKSAMLPPHNMLLSMHLSVSLLVLKCPSFHTKLNGKAIQLQPWTASEGSRKLRFPDFKKISKCRW